jgi:hypothetical protein
MPVVHEIVASIDAVDGADGFGGREPDQSVV